MTLTVGELARKNRRQSFPVLVQCATVTWHPPGSWLVANDTVISSSPVFRTVMVYSAGEPGDASFEDESEDRVTETSAETIGLNDTSKNMATTLRQRPRAGVRMSGRRVDPLKRAPP